MSEPDDLLRVMGIDIPEEDRAHLLAAWRGIAAEIAKLRTLDLSEEHPAVIFDPTLGMPR